MKPIPPAVLSAFASIVWLAAMPYVTATTQLVSAIGIGWVAVVAANVGARDVSARRDWRSIVGLVVALVALLWIAVVFLAAASPRMC